MSWPGTRGYCRPGQSPSFTSTSLWQIPPARYAHINPYGKYRFNVEGEFHRKGLRPLRRPDSVMA